MGGAARPTWNNHIIQSTRWRFELISFTLHLITNSLEYEINAHKLLQFYRNYFIRSYRREIVLVNVGTL